MMKLKESTGLSLMRTSFVIIILIFVDVFFSLEHGLAPTGGWGMYRLSGHVFDRLNECVLSAFFDSYIIYNRFAYWTDL